MRTLEKTATDLRTHWDTVYRTRPETEVSWYQDEPRLSLELIHLAAPERTARIIDVGGGASVLVDRLLDDGYRRPAVLDLSATALEVARARLGGRAAEVDWLVADITRVESLGPFDLWHDRAVFHFLTDPEHRHRYVGLATRTLPPGGHLIIATFALDGPERCSGLPVCRYDPAALSAAVGPAFALVRSADECHQTPAGAAQHFTYCLFRRVAPPR